MSLHVQRILTATRFNVALLELLSFIFDPTVILPSHRGQFLTGIAYNDRGLPLYNAWLQAGDNFRRMLTEVGNVDDVLYYTLSFNTQQADIDQLTAFMASQQQVPRDLRAAINDGLADARQNVAWLAVNLNPITQYLESGQWRRQS